MFLKYVIKYFRNIVADQTMPIAKRKKILKAKMVEIGVEHGTFGSKTTSSPPHHMHYYVLA
jgi:hypothetical protein